MESGGAAPAAAAAASSLTQTEETRRQFFEALCRISNEEKTAYLRAIAECPFLVQTESPIERFLRREDFNIDNAARRFVEYWDKR